MPAPAHPTCRWALALTLAALALLPSVAAGQTPPVRTVPKVDLDRYVGIWYEISRYPNKYQRDCESDVRASYSRRPDGRLDVVNVCRTSDGIKTTEGVARVVDEETSSKLEVRFAPAWLSWVPAVWGDYWIIGLADDYSWAVVGDPGHEYLWILARSPRVDDRSLAAAHAAATENGFDVSKLEPTRHSDPVL